MTLKEKIAFCSGRDFWHTKECRELQLPSVMLSDGPNGLRKQGEKTDIIGMNRSEKATCFPGASLLACSFSTDTAFEYGRLLGEEARAMDVDAVLGPGINIKRNPLCGRNFEYLSEDPQLAGKMAAAYVRGMQSTGTGSCLKHFACNSQEYFRMTSDSLVDQRALREIYLRAFEIAVKEAKPQLIMGAYNLINGVYCCSDKKLMDDILRKEWGFEGAVVTDWAAVADRAESFEAGCDLIMPGGNAWQEDRIEGRVSEERIEASFNAVADFARKHSEKREKSSFSEEEHHEAVRGICEDCAVLLSNKGGILPLKNLEDTCFIGYMAQDIRYQGAGSSMINPSRLDQITGLYPGVPYAPGCSRNGDTSPEMLKEAVELAAKHRNVIAFVGLPDTYESEGFDRDNMRLPQGQLKLIDELLKVNENVIVLLFSGSAVELDFADEVKAVLYIGLPGQAGARAAMNLVLGKAVPSGRLAETWPMKYEDCVSSAYYGSRCGMKDAQYRESIYVGYRYYDKAQVPVRYQFGWGLSYTSFSYSDLWVSEDGKTASVTVRNTGDYPGKEAVLLYVCPPEEQLFRPKRELKAFEKVFLEPGEEKKVTLRIDDSAYSTWDGGWKVYSGKYTVQVGELEKSVDIEGEEYSPMDVPEWYLHPAGAPTEQDFIGIYGALPEKAAGAPFTINSTLADMKESSLLLRIAYNIYELISARKNGRGSAVYRGTMSIANECPIRAIQNNLLIKGKFDEIIVRMVNRKKQPA